MISVTENDYKNLARILLDAIGEANYYNGSLDYDTPESRSELRITAMIYREPLLDPDDPTRTRERITEIVPVWWEYRTFAPEGEVPNDFGWRELKEHLR